MAAVDKALKVGAVESYVIDVKDEFATDYVLVALQSHAYYEQKYPLVSALSRPLISKKLVEIAHQTGATTIAHGCTGKITEPNKPAVEVPNVTTPAKITPETPETEKPVAIEITRKPNGNAIVTPKKPDGKNYPSGSKVVIPGENNTPITVTIGDNGSGEVPNDNLPKTDVPGTGTVTESNKKPSQPVNVTTAAKAEAKKAADDATSSKTN